MKRKPSSQDNKCLRCGKCCYYYSPKEETWFGCPYLTIDGHGFATCIRYHKRIGTKLPNGQLCGHRKDSGYDIPGCPCNDGRPKHPYFYK